MRPRSELALALARIDGQSVRAEHLTAPVPRSCARASAAVVFRYHHAKEMTFPRACLPVPTAAGSRAFCPCHRHPGSDLVCVQRLDGRVGLTSGSCVPCSRTWPSPRHGLRCTAKARMSRSPCGSITSAILDLWCPFKVGYLCAIASPMSSCVRPRWRMDLVLSTPGRSSFAKPGLRVGVSWRCWCRYRLAIYLIARL